MIKFLKNKIIDNKKVFSKYVLISLASYLYVFVSLFIMVDHFKCDEHIAFIIVYGIAYLALYNIHLKYLFFKKHDNKKVFRYGISILIFYVLVNVIYNLTLYSGVNYLFSTAISVIVLIPIRFLTYKYFVYKN